MRFIDAYGDHSERSRLTGVECLDDSLTVQSDAKDADINTIVERFGLTGMMPQNVRVPLEEDFTEVFDFRSAMEAMRTAEESFAQLPARVRLRFNNDPAAFVDFCVAEKDGVLVNLEEMRKLGLAVPAAPPPSSPDPPAPAPV